MIHILIKDYSENHKILSYYDLLIKKLSHFSETINIVFFHHLTSQTMYFIFHLHQLISISVQLKEYIFQLVLIEDPKVLILIIA